MMNEILLTPNNLLDMAVPWYRLHPTIDEADRVMQAIEMISRATGTAAASDPLGTSSRLRISHRLIERRSDSALSAGNAGAEER